MTYKLVGQEPYQIPSNADLGTLAYQNADAITAGLINISNTATISGLVAPLTVSYSQAAAGTLLYLSQVPTNLSTGGTVSGTSIAANTTVASFVSGYQTYQTLYTSTTATTVLGMTSTYGISASMGVGGTGITYGTIVSSISNTGVPVTYQITSATVGGNTIYVGTTTNVVANSMVLGAGFSTSTLVTSLVANTSITLNQPVTTTLGQNVTFAPTITLSQAIVANTLTQNLLFFPTVTLSQATSAAVTQGAVVNAYYNSSNAGNASLVIQNGGIGVTGNSYFANNLTVNGNIIGSATTATNLAGGATGGIPYQTAAGATNFIGIGTLGQVLQSNGTTASWVSTSSLIAGTAYTATTILNGTAGQLVYQSAPGVTAFTGPGTAGQILVSAGTAAPVYTNTGSIYVGNSARVDTVAQTANASYYPTFVDANNPTAASEIVYTTSSFIINPSSGNIRVASSTEYVAKAKLQLNYGDDSVGTNAYAQLALGYSGGGYNHLVQTYHNATLNDGNAIVFYLNTGTVAATSNAVGVGNTSSYFMGYQTHRWSTSGIERMRLDANGNLGVGLTAPLSKLHVSGDARITGITTVSNTTAVSSTSTGALQVGGGVGVAGGMFVAGIFTASASLAYFGSAANPVILDSNSNPRVLYAPGASFTFAGGGNSVGAGSGVPGITANNGGSFDVYGGLGNINLRTGGAFSTVVTHTSSTFSTLTGALRVIGGVGIGGGVFVGGTVTATNFVGSFNGTVSTATSILTTAQPANASYYPTFVDANNATSAAELVYTTSSFVINPSSGAVGIGTASPASRLHIEAASVATNIIATSGNGIIRLGDSVAGATRKEFTTILDTTNNRVDLQAVQQGVAFMPVTINAGGGNVGIGLTAPLSKLHVSGDVRVTGITTVTNNTAASSTITGAFQVVGGIGIGGNSYIGGNEVITGTLQVNSTNADTATNTSNALYTAGGAWISKTLVVGGDTTFKGSVVFQGTNTFVYSSSTVYTDNLISLHAPSGSTPGNHTWTVDDGKDIGFMFHYYKGSDKDAFLGFANDTQYLEWYSDGVESGGVFTGTTYGTFKTGGIRLVGGSSNSGNTTTGDLQVLGGVGIGGGLYVGGTVTATSFVGAFNGSVIGAATQVNTIAQTANASYYPTFVDANNATAIGESVYTTSSFVINPSTGNVGIGTASPGMKLDVQGTSIDARVYSTNAGGKARLFVRGDTANMSYESDGTAQTSILFDNVAGQSAYVYGLGASGYWRLFTAGTEKLRIDSVGKVGIGTASPASLLHVAGDARITGITTVTNNTAATSTITGAFQVAGGAGIGGALYVGAGVASTSTGTGSLVVNGGVGINGALNAITKSFNISHPTKPGMNLRYGSLEGPEFGVYVRGRLTGSNTIELPDYWIKLVDPDTITVNLTPIGAHQKLYVEDVIGCARIIIGNDNLFNKGVDCYYTVYAERADIDRLVVEG